MNPRLAIASRRVARRAATDVPGSRRTPLGQAGPDLRRSTFGSAHVCTRRPQRPATAIRPRARRCSTAHAHRSQRHPIAPRAAAVATRAQATSPKPFVRLSITPASPTEATASGRGPKTLADRPLRQRGAHERDAWFARIVRAGPGGDRPVNLEAARPRAGP